jgi:hypothetical protein
MLRKYDDGWCKWASKSDRQRLEGTVAALYREQFGCTPVPPERDFKGKA